VGVCVDEAGEDAFAAKIDVWRVDGGGEFVLALEDFCDEA